MLSLFFFLSFYNSKRCVMDELEVICILADRKSFSVFSFSLQVFVITLIELPHPLI